MWLRLVLAWAAIGAVTLSETVAMAEPVGHVTGVGGVFMRSKDPKALADWYHDVLGLEIKPWGGAKLSYDAPGHPPVMVWSPFSEANDHMAPSTREFMINFAVDDMDAIVRA